jgi:hypothetical protein
LRIKFRVGEGGIVELIVTPASVAVQLYENVFPELPSVVEGESRRSDDVFGGITVGVKDRCTYQFAQI